MTGPNDAPPGWYPTPDGTQHWWDGTQWTASAPAPPVTGQHQQEKTLAILAHVGPIIAGFIAPLIVWIVTKDDATKSEWVRHHAREALNFQISLMIYATVGWLLGFVVTLFTFGFALLVLIPLLFVCVFATIAVSIVAAVKANSGEWFRYPLSIRFLN